MFVTYVFCENPSFYGMALVELIREVSRMTKQFLLDKTDGPLRDLVNNEWQTVSTFLLVLPFKFFFFLWVLSGGALAEYGFIRRNIAFGHVAVFIVMVAVMRVVFSHIIEPHDHDSESSDKKED